MNPPKGIDPKVWEMAWSLVHDLASDAVPYWAMGDEIKDARIEDAKAISNAIAQFVADEREECAKIADPIHYDGRMSDYEKQAFDIRDIISQAIRNRSNTTTERNEG